MIRILWIFLTISRGSIAESPLRNFDSFQDAGDDLVARDVLRLGLVREEDPVAQDVRGDFLHVLGNDVAAALQEGVGPGGREERERGAGEAPYWTKSASSGRP